MKVHDRRSERVGQQINLVDDEADRNLVDGRGHEQPIHKGGIEVGQADRLDDPCAIHVGHHDVLLPRAVAGRAAAQLIVTVVNGQDQARVVLVVDPDRDPIADRHGIRCVLVFQPKFAANPGGNDAVADPDVVPASGRTGHDALQVRVLVLIGARRAAHTHVGVGGRETFRWERPSMM